MVASKLSIYNNALTLLGEEVLASLDEDRAPRYAMDTVWDDGLVRACIEEGYWYFAIRSVQLDNDPDITPDFGFPYAFTKPDDYVRLAAMSYDEYFCSQILRYTDEAENWWTDATTIYIKYISDDEQYGMNYGAWPESFNELVQFTLATKACVRITGDKEKYESMKKDRDKMLRNARSKDAMNMATTFFPLGSWARARYRQVGLSRVPQGIFNANGFIDY